MANPRDYTVHWRESSRQLRFWIFDAQAAFPLLLFLLHIRVWTAIVAGITTFFFATLARFGFTIPIFLRRVRTFLSGPRKLSEPWWKKEKRLY